MAHPAVTILLVAAGLLHAWLQLYNRFLLTIPDSPRKPVWHQLSLAVVVLAPLVCLAAFRSSDAVVGALSWQPATMGGRVLFASFGVLWLAAVWRFWLWLADRLWPRRPRHLVSETVSRPPVPHGHSRLPVVLRPLETTYELEVHERELAVPGLAPEFDGLRVAHVSDVHFELTANQRGYYRAIERLVAGFAPDVVCFTGDFVNRRRLIPASAHYHGRMRGRAATLCVFGNHDYWTDPAGLRDAVAENGIRAMHNERFELERGGRRLVFAGTDAPWGGRRTDFHHLLSKGPGDAVVLLSHTPDNAPEAAAAGANLVLSGHNHAGQYCLPLVGPIVVPSRTGHRFVHGIYDLGADCVLCVSAGIGASVMKSGGRTCAPPELCLYTLRAPYADVAVGAREGVPESGERMAVRGAAPLPG